ncbi:MAG: ParA family protein [Nautiliaceae bacterium]
MEIIAIVNPKGGVGKTTTAINLAAVLAERGKRVLLVDTDFQMHATTSLGVRKIEYDLFHLLKKIKHPNEVIVKTPFKIDVIPSSLGLLKVDEIYLNKNSILEDVLREIEYDYVIIDTPPSLNPLNIDVLKFADNILIPIQANVFSLESLKMFLSTISLFKATANQKLKIKGILPTIFIRNSNFSKQILQDLKRDFGDKLFWERNEVLVIPKSLKVEEAVSFCKPIIYYDDSNIVSKAYRRLVDFI